MADHPPHNPNPPTSAGGPAEEDSSHEAGDRSRGAGSALPPFTPGLLRRQRRVDALLGVAAMLGIFIVVLMVFLFVGGADTTVLVLMALTCGAWVTLSRLSAQVAHRLPQLGALIEADPDAAEAVIAHELRRRPLVRWVRLMLYQRLAVVRHHQQRHAEAVAICQAVLAYPLGPAGRVRPQLLLMLAEGRLQFGDVIGAYPPLLELYHLRLGLTESLQRLALQTRYEVMVGRPDAAIAHAHRKIEMAELMPAPQCGAVHALLAAAAQRTHRPDLGQRLWRRAELLCTPTQLQQTAGAAGMTHEEVCS